MDIMNGTDPDVLLAPIAEEEWLPARLMGRMTSEDREAHGREILARRTLGEKFRDALRRAWYGPDPEPLTDDEMRIIMCSRDDEDDGLPERVPPNDPGRLAWEAELRAIGVRPAKKWSFPVRVPFRRPTVWQRIKHRVSRGW